MQQNTAPLPLSRLASCALDDRAQDAIQENDLPGPFFVAEICVYTYTSAMKHSDCAQLLHRIAQIQHMEPGKLCVMRQAPTGLITTCNGVRTERPSAAMCPVIRLKRWPKTPPTMSNSRPWSLNMLSSLSNKPVPSGPQALKKRHRPRDPHAPRPGNPAAASITLLSIY